jgi:DNA-binding beta-propeller fold protein YncE
VTTLISSGLNEPCDVALDNSGNIYIADAGDNAIKEWNSANGNVTTLVSSGLNSPSGVALDSAGNVYIADTDNGAIKEWMKTSSNVITLVSSVSTPYGVGVDVAGNVYVGDTGGSAIMEWTKAIGDLSTLVTDYTPDYLPYNLVVDGTGDVYAAATSYYGPPYYGEVEEWSAATGGTSTFGFSGLTNATGLALDGGGNVYFSSPSGNSVYERPYVFVDTALRLESRAAGSDVLPPVLPATANLLPLFAPTSSQPWLVINGVTNGVVSFSFSANVGIARTANLNFLGQTIPVTQSGPAFNLGTSSLTVGSGAGSNSVVLAVAPNVGVWTATPNATWLHISPATQNGTGATNVLFSCDANSGLTRSAALRIAGQPLTVTQAGSNYVSADPLTTLASSGLVQPKGVAVDGAGNVYIANTESSSIEEWMVSNNSLATLVSSGLNRPQGLAVGGTGNIYMADTGNNAIKEWTAADSNVTILVSSGLNQPQGVAVDNAGNVYIADTYNGAIKEWMKTSSNMFTLVSSGLSLPAGVAVDAAGNAYIADTGDRAIKEWTAANSNLTILASFGTANLSGITVDGSGNVYIADSANSLIEKWTVVSNALTTLVSSGLNGPSGLAVDGLGNVYLADTDNNDIKELPVAFVNPTPRLEGLAAGSDILPALLPTHENLSAPFTPTSDQAWLTVTGITDGEVSFSFTANTGLSRMAHVTLLGQPISVTQAAGNASPPSFSPPSGTSLTNGSLITISCATLGAVIYFTTNGSPVTTNSAVYGAPIGFTGPGPLTLQALAVASGYGASSAAATYSFPQVAAPVFTPPSGPITNATTLSITCATTGALVYYTLDGSVPSTNSTLYSDPLVINGGVTVRAYAVAAGHINSTVTSVTYGPAQAAIPQFTPGQGPVTNGTLIYITCSTSNAIIYYTVDGSTPTSNSPIYTQPLLFTNQFALQAQAYAGGFVPSGIVSAFYGLLDIIPNVAVTTFAGSPTAGFVDGNGVAAAFSNPQGICIDSAGNLFVADTGNNAIRKIFPSGQVITYAGNGKVLDSKSPSSTLAVFNGPIGVCLDQYENLYMAESGGRVSKIGIDGTFAIYANIHGGVGQLITDTAGNLYVGAWAEAYEILPDRSVLALAGTSCACPGGWSVNVGLGLDSATNLYAATGNDVWMITPSGSVNLFAGGSGQISDGAALTAGFASLTSAAVDSSNNIYLSDAVRIRKLSPSGWVSTVAGTGVAGFANGPGSAAQFNGTYQWPIQMGICADAVGNLYVSDIANNCIRKVSFNTVALPSLQFTASTNLLTMVWPGWASNFILESSPTLSDGGSWQTVTNGTMALQGGTNLVWTGEIGNGILFYRLHAQ